MFQCLFAITGEPEKTDFKDVRSYQMISSIPQIENNNHFEPCGNKTVGPWGNLFPIFSKEANAIYKNGHCAKLDNITDGVFWNAILKCRDYKPENLQAHMETGLLPKDCRVQFRYPGDFKDIQPQICYRDMIDVCTTTEFNVPVSINATKDDITEVCQSGLVSPYYGHLYLFYANVFCHICSGYFFDENYMLCSKFQDENERTGPDIFGMVNGPGIFGLLNIGALDTLQDARKTGALIDRKISSACSTNTEQVNILLFRF